MKRFFALISIISLLSLNISYAQDSLAFKPSGKVIVRSFMDYSTGFGHVNDESGFDITRAFLGYSYKFAPKLEGQIIIDGAAGRTSTNSLDIYLRNAFVRYSDKGLTINLGLTGLMQFSTQEKYWMHRYVLKSFQDLNKMAPSVDLGVTAEYRINEFLSADLSLTNGEGYKKVKKDNNMRYAAGISIFPVKNTILRVYADIYNDDENLRDALPEGVDNASFKDQYTLSVLGGYQNEKISFGAEYNRVYNKGFISKKDYYGYSFYTSVKVASKWRAFGRYDLMDSKKPDNFTSEWNDLDGQLIMAGVEFRPWKQFKVAPNFRNINPTRGKSEQYLFINLEFNL